MIDGRDIEEDERSRVESYFSDQNNLRDEVSVKSAMMIPEGRGGGGGGVKLPIKIKSVVLDGVEMKLSSNSLFGKPF